jgi:DNA anti-recombination protein RmuC
LCGIKSKRFLLLLVLVSVLSVSPCFSKVVLTDEEAKEMMSEIEESKKELTELRETSQKQIESLENSLEQSKSELETVRNTSQEQKKSYEEQLKEEKKKRILPWVMAGTSGTATIILSVVLLIALL